MAARRQREAPGQKQPRSTTRPSMGGIRSVSYAYSADPAGGRDEAELVLAALAH
jgi:hypothetical protein